MGRASKQGFGCLPCFGGGSHNLAIKLSKRISSIKNVYEEEEDDEERDYEEAEEEEERDYRQQEEDRPSTRVKPFSLMKFPELRMLSSSSSKEFFRNGSERKISAQTFTYWELAAATENFRPECFLGEGGFGRVYRGTLQKTRQVVAVKQLDRNGLQGNKEFLVEVLILSLINHTNLVNLVGYCADGEQRLLVYEFMSHGSLEDHLFDLPPGREPLDWNTRIQIAAGAASGLEYLHDKADPPVIYRDFKSANILLDENFHPKLSDFGLAKFGPIGDKSHVSTRVMGTYGYCAPEYALTGQLTVKSDVFSFGVVLLELITGRRAIDHTKPGPEQNLVDWARPLFKDRKKFPQMADPMLQGKYPMRGLYQALAVAAMCLQEQGETRPLIADVVTALKYLSSQAYDADDDHAVARTISPKNSKREKAGHKSKKQLISSYSNSNSNGNGNGNGNGANNSYDEPRNLMHE